MTTSNSQSGSTSTVGPLGRTDRMLHALLRDEEAKVGSHLVRYDREGRWYREDISFDRESPDDGKMISRTRLGTVHDAVAAALAMEERGGEIFSNKPGGNRFDYMVEAAKQKRARGR